MRFETETVWNEWETRDAPEDERQPMNLIERSASKEIRESPERVVLF